MSETVLGKPPTLRAARAVVRHAVNVMEAAFVYTFKGNSEGKLLSLIFPFTNTSFRDLVRNFPDKQAYRGEAVVRSFVLFVGAR